ncbi:tyrosine-protein phosphatase 99A isoform X2 [Stomoxys calcitrans]|uniref:tyrosine-protein phosphatase 99A isoform X2 n=1 Tax=Stomoxys calcitrans TaxID=35570 RepID=UPI0027E2F80D|nr:tyrosine-protein phosphatase 99A isoform X2 [Stomoxys calcitrans]
MARSKCQNTARFFLKLFLFVGIIQENLGGPMATASAAGATVPPPVPPFEVELSSPVPFTTRKPEISIEASDNKDKTAESPNTTNNSTPALEQASPVDPTSKDYETNKDLNNEDPMNTNYYDDISETDIKAERTTPTSMEQQDGPAIPPTTITFSNVAAAGILGDTSSNMEAGGGGNGTPITINDATPPYAAVDDKYVPSKPQNLTVLDVTATSITMSWHPPKNQNGAIAGYHVYHIHENQTGVEIVKRSAADSAIRFELPKLKPFTEYRIKVNAFTTKNEGDTSDTIVQRTDVGAPSAPIIVNLTCHSQDSLTIRWKRPLEFYNNIDFYVIKTKVMGQDAHRDVRINSSAKELETAMIIQNLTMYQLYEVKVAAATYSVIIPNKIILGKFSDGRKIGLQPNCEKLQPLLRQSHNDYNLAVLVGIIFSCFGIVLIVMAFFLWRKCFHAAYYYLDDPPHHPNVPQVDWEVPVEIAGEIRAAVPVNEFAKHVASLHADGDIGFSREYEAIQNECITDDLPCEHSQHPENKKKNRYLNITAYDHSRVHLHPTPGQKKNLDYINANFIDGYQKSRAFIGTQGPLPDTFDCFWRMIWEQRVAIIIMITNLVERGRRKCDMYWPKEGVETYGVIQVKLVEEEVTAMYTVRTFQIKHLKLKKKKQCNSEKMVYQYHYTNWPDHGTPDHPLPVLNFVKKSSAANPSDAGPIVVHCSAGVGRTGTYIVLDAMLKQIQQKGVVNTFGFLRHIRIQRNFLVQTEEQYIFIHDALVEAIASGETNLTSQQIEELKNCTPYLEQQYRNIIQFQTKDVHIASAMKQVNSIKNRGAIFPIEGSRVHLTPKPGEEGSDYINASWLHGFRRLRDFIVTQHPMAHTVKDFWQMVWDHNAQTIVLLSSLDEINFAQFWPDDTSPIESDYYRVKFLSKTNKNDYVSRDFVIQSIQDDYELSVKMLHCPSWPEMSNPSSIYDFIVDVHDRGNDYRNGPIVVVDRYGGAQACTFCAISSLAIEMEYSQTANIYQYAKLYHNKRPGVWTSSEDIRLIYNILALLPRNLQLLKRTAIKMEIEDVTTATPDLYSKICSNGNNDLQKHNNDLKRNSSSQNPNLRQKQNQNHNPNSNSNSNSNTNSITNSCSNFNHNNITPLATATTTTNTAPPPTTVVVGATAAATAAATTTTTTSSQIPNHSSSQPTNPTPQNSISHNNHHLINATATTTTNPNHSTTSSILEHTQHNQNNHHNHHLHHHQLHNNPSNTTHPSSPTSNNSNLCMNLGLNNETNSNFNNSSNTITTTTTTTTTTNTNTTTSTNNHHGDGNDLTSTSATTLNNSSSTANALPSPTFNNNNQQTPTSMSTIAPPPPSPPPQFATGIGENMSAPTLFQQQMLALLNQQQYVQHYAHPTNDITDVDCDNITSYTPPPPPAAFNTASNNVMMGSPITSTHNNHHQHLLQHHALHHIADHNPIDAIADYPMGYNPSSSSLAANDADYASSSGVTPSTSSSTVVNANEITTPLLKTSSNPSSPTTSSPNTPTAPLQSSKNGACPNNLTSTVTDAQSLDIVG